MRKKKKRKRKKKTSLSSRWTIPHISRGHPVWIIHESKSLPLAHYKLIEEETLATPGRDKQEVSLEVGARGKAKVSPSTLLQRRFPRPTRRGGERHTRERCWHADVFRGDFGTEGSPPGGSDDGISLWQKGINRWHWARGEINIYTFRQETGSSNSGGQTKSVFVCLSACVCVCMCLCVRREVDC